MSKALRSAASCIALSLFATVVDAQARPVEYADADNLHEAAGMVVGAEIWSFALRDRCSAHFPDLAPQIAAHHLVYLAEIARFKAAAIAVVGTNLERLTTDSTPKMAEAIEKLLPDASERSRQACIGMVTAWRDGEKTLREHSPQAGAFLDEYIEKHPFDYWDEEGFASIAGCTKQAVNSNQPARIIAPVCECMWQHTRETVSREEYEAFGRAVREGKMSESPEARKIVQGATDCALLAVDQKLAEPDNPLGQAKAAAESKQASDGKADDDG